jgi:hypothetical protein
VQNFVDYTLHDLENLVATAPYSQYHQMLLALKRNELSKSTIYQPYLGSLPDLKNLLKEEAKNINPISEIENTTPSESHIIADKSHQEEEKNINSLSKPKDMVSVESQPVSNKSDQPPSKISTEGEFILVKKDKPKEKQKKKSKKEKSEKLKQATKKKKTKKKKTKKLVDLVGLSDYSKWLLLGELTEGKQKSKTKSTKKTKGDKHQAEKPEVISEPLAQLLALQGHKDKAIEMYEKLVKLFPEKEKEYLDTIDQIKNS